MEQLRAHHRDVSVGYGIRYFMRFGGVSPDRVMIFPRRKVVSGLQGESRDTRDSNPR
jgi:hypothetical protein